MILRTAFVPRDGVCPFMQEDVYRLFFLKFVANPNKIVVIHLATITEPVVGNLDPTNFYRHISRTLLFEKSDYLTIVLHGSIIYTL